MDRDRNLNVWTGSVPIFRSYLYVPGSDPSLINKALKSRADAIVIDLEDAVTNDQKQMARANASAVLAESQSKPVLVRINSAESGYWRMDLEAVGHWDPPGIRVPKVESVATVVQVASFLSSLDSGSTPLIPLIESALGVERAFEIASAHHRVIALGMGEADLGADLGTNSSDALNYPRSRCIVAARAAGLAAAIQSVYVNLHDPSGLRSSTEFGRSLGFFGRSAIHPSQIDAINEVFTPSDNEVSSAQEIVSIMGAASSLGSGLGVTQSGEFVDAAILRRARAILSVAQMVENLK